MSSAGVTFFGNNIGYENVTLHHTPFDVFGGSSGIQGIHCVDVHGRIISRGVHYVPGPDECIHCVCDEGGPQLCRAMLCQPPQHQGCKATRVGTSCCDFICLEDEAGVGGGGGGNRGNGPPYGNFAPVDMGVVIPKIIITALLSMLSLSLLFFLVHRLRQREIRGRLNSLEARRARQMCDECDDTRSLDFSVYDFERSPIPNAHLFPPQYMTWWKPPSYFFPQRSEAPPPYEEAIASTSNMIPLLNLPSSEAPGIQSIGETIAGDLHNLDHSKIEKEILLNKVDVAAAEDESKGHVDNEQIPGPSSRINSSQLLESRQESQPQPQHSNSEKVKPSPPPYSDLVSRPATYSNISRRTFRRSLTLPRRPNFLATEFGDSEESPFEQNQQQRYSLQLRVADWNSSSSSSLSLTPSSPILIRDPSSSSSSSAFSRST